MYATFPPPYCAANQLLTYISRILLSKSISPFPVLQLLSVFLLVVQRIITAIDKNISLSLLICPPPPFPISALHTRAGTDVREPRTEKTNRLFKRALLFSPPPPRAGSGRGCEQIVRIQWIAARESINWGLCK